MARRNRPTEFGSWHTDKSDTEALAHAWFDKAKIEAQTAHKPSGPGVAAIHIDSFIMPTAAEQTCSQREATHDPLGDAMLEPQIRCYRCDRLVTDVGEQYDRYLVSTITDTGHKVMKSLPDCPISNNLSEHLNYGYALLPCGCHTQSEEASAYRRELYHRRMSAQSPRAVELPSLSARQQRYQQLLIGCTRLKDFRGTAVTINQQKAADYWAVIFADQMRVCGIISTYRPTWEYPLHVEVRSWAQEKSLTNLLSSEASVDILPAGTNVVAKDYNPAYPKPVGLGNVAQPSLLLSQEKLQYVYGFCIANSMCLGTMIADECGLHVTDQKVLEHTDSFMQHLRQCLAGQGKLNLFDARMVNCLLALAKQVFPQPATVAEPVEGVLAPVPSSPLPVSKKRRRTVRMIDIDD